MKLSFLLDKSKAWATVPGFLSLMAALADDGLAVPVAVYHGYLAVKALPRYQEMGLFWIHAGILQGLTLAAFRQENGGGLWVGGIFGLLIQAYLHQSRTFTTTIRGAEIVRSRALSPEEMERMSRAPFGAHGLTLEGLATHVAFIGSTRSGKTLSMNLIMQNVLRQRQTRAIVHDPAHSLYPLLLGMGIDRERVKIMNPFDRRGHGWDMAADVVTPTDAQNFAEVIVPRLPGSKDEEFWYGMTVICIKGIIRGFNAHAREAGKPAAWRFRDLLLALRSEKIYKAILSVNGEVKRHLQHYADNLGGEVTAANIRVSIMQRIERYESIAAQWEHLNRFVALASWPQSNSILLLGSNTRTKTELQAINQALITFAGQVALEREDHREADTFFFLDEWAGLGRIDYLTKLTTEGAKKGISMIYGFQAKPHIDELYGGPRIPDTILSNVNHKAIFRQSDADTAEWCAKQAGIRQVHRVNRSEQKNILGITTGTSASEQITDERNVYASELLGIKPVENTLFIRGLFLSYEMHWHSRPLEITLKQLAKPAEDVPGHWAAPKDWQYLEPWTTADMDRLHLPHSILKADEPHRAEPDLMDWDNFAVE
ncbi:hypothetical protein VF14_18285 [Nostoc linckia z18]|uniref:Type IV secretion system coupling protein TraD DNA-binding domain-containing protein n=2 Tax=Nostoc linckia TaxID=92942 RepID=A0A9Q6EJG6_NOSLI|nr:type IV secretion system DNA-binding domain-containing protein [Nostoc linckia]PHJ52791.1 hypothetical protein VF02_37495 [Nostoc linckia z1]PHJ81980.1 hypothetical protein VF07_29245 [Nostoc linckia z6]PHJ92879.1 hypothetical protein VF04_27960 [Nostoc linckia z7]PHK00799.1 hypothetical protein VF08_23285 [Nostoc linckia z8]PHK09324.1 hypothetical protein VF09_16020 [Nostoc linckia z9]